MFNRLLFTACVAAIIAAPALAQTAALEDLPQRDRIEWIDAAKSAGHTGIARKTRPVDARLTEPGEIIVTKIAGQGTETRSKPAGEGDWVVRNRCDQTGDEEYLVSAAKFPSRYGDPVSEPDAGGYREFRPTGRDMTYAIVPEADGEFAIEAPWGELQRVLPGDAIVQVPDDMNDTYRVEARAFECTYEIVEPAK
ncbi:MAG: hypothetical protein KDJ77_12740 [Rhodobiaceae bacterium]|nr:hypothetical protein [Rhodobiaceae bacterium]